ncbi:MFS transporter [Nocardia sp. CDC160]|uniref:MFS transporter n=1 Tax=Nocardia sp. CDC160 TaxID=3112166 RepID=UPI002DB699DD|nr:MFS transporter [Nocardia sp. CDC160]MEC3913443.1 MFS transporter [Nocardia sp. CDC160]
MPIAVFALALCAFAIGLTEFVVAGLLPNIATDLHASIPAAGLLVSGYALGVVIGAPLLTALTGTVERRRLLTGLMTLFLFGSVVSALAPGYGVLMLGRILAALAHGAFMGVGIVAAGELVPADKRGRALSLVISGATLATVLGVPFGTLIGQQLGWRATFWIVAVCAAVGLAGVATLVPRAERAAQGDLRTEFTTLRQPQVLLVLLITVLGFGGVMTSYTFIAEMATRVTGFASGSVIWITMLFGLGTVVGNLASGRFTDRYPRAAVPVALGLLALVLAVLTLAIHDKAATCVTVFLFGAAAFGTLAPLQMRVMAKAQAAPTLASATNVAAFNLANTVGPLLGGALLNAGFGYPTLNLAGALVTATGLTVALRSLAAERPRTIPAEPALITA